LDFPNALDPDNPLQKLKDYQLDVYHNQSVPNLYLQVAQLTGVFPSCLRLMVSDQILRHRGLITATECTTVDGVTSGRCPGLQKHSIVTVLMLCTEGMTIPQGQNGLPAGFPASFLPEGLTRHILAPIPYVTEGVDHDGEGPQLYEDKYEAAISALPAATERRLKMARFNSQERFNRKLFVAEMKASWDFTLQTEVKSDRGPTNADYDQQMCKILGTTSADYDQQMQQDEDYALFLDYMVDKMKIYDDDYKARAIDFKSDIDGYEGDKEMTANQRAQVDADYRRRQARTEQLWKGLARLKRLRVIARLNGSSCPDSEVFDSPSFNLKGLMHIITRTSP
jgi:hypothetical protein